MHAAALREIETPRQEIDYRESLARQRARLADRVAALQGELEATEDKLAQIDRTLGRLRAS